MKNTLEQINQHNTIQYNITYITGLLQEALQVIEKSLVHTPTALDMYTKKAKILKKCGRIQEAAVVMDYCRSLGKCLYLCM